MTTSPDPSFWQSGPTFQALWALRESPRVGVDLDRNDIAVLDGVVKCMNFNGWAHPGASRIARIQDMGLSTVKESLAKLRRLGVLIRGAGGGGRDVAPYRIDVEALLAKPAIRTERHDAPSTPWPGHAVTGSHGDRATGGPAPIHETAAPRPVRAPFEDQEDREDLEDLGEGTAELSHVPTRRTPTVLPPAAPIPSPAGAETTTDRTVNNSPPIAADPPAPDTQLRPIEQPRPPSDRAAPPSPEQVLVLASPAPAPVKPVRKARVPPPPREKAPSKIDRYRAYADAFQRGYSRGVGREVSVDAIRSHDHPLVRALHTHARGPEKNILKNDDVIAWLEDKAERFGKQAGYERYSYHRFVDFLNGDAGGGAAAAPTRGNYPPRAYGAQPWGTPETPVPFDETEADAKAGGTFL
jgi:hypothetical protein